MCLHCSVCTIFISIRASHKMWAKLERSVNNGCLKRNLWGPSFTRTRKRWLLKIQTRLLSQNPSLTWTAKTSDEGKRNKKNREQTPQKKEQTDRRKRHDETSIQPCIRQERRWRPERRVYHQIHHHSTPAAWPWKDSRRVKPDPNQHHRSRMGTVPRATATVMLFPSTLFSTKGE